MSGFYSDFLVGELSCWGVILIFWLEHFLDKYLTKIFCLRNFPCWSFFFERFSAKLQNAYKKFENNGRAVYNGDIVDALWSRVQDSSLQTYLASLRADYLRN